MMLLGSSVCCTACFKCFECASDLHLSFALAHSMALGAAFNPGDRLAACHWSAWRRRHIHERALEEGHAPAA